MAVRTSVAAVHGGLLLAALLLATMIPGGTGGTGGSGGSGGAGGAGHSNGSPVRPGPGGRVAPVAFAVVGSRASTVAGVPAALPFDPAPLAGRCGDPAGSWLGVRWPGALEWGLNVATIPGYLGDEAATAAIRAAARAVTAGRNECGLPEDVAIDQWYRGDTDRYAGVSREGACTGRDEHNVVSFGQLAPGLLALACVWWDERQGAGTAVEADILVDRAAGSFFVTAPPNCGGSWDLESILTHEFGHVFGLGHVSYDQHPALTMSDALPDCTTAYRGLGLGDYLTLRAHYQPA